MPDRATSPDRLTYYTQVPSPIGPLLLTSDGGALTRLYMTERGADLANADLPAVDLAAWDLAAVPAGWVRDDDALPFPKARAQLAAYFAGTRTDFDLPLAPAGTPFQRRVWDALRTIPYGTTTSYGALARQIGDAGASRAVGLANGRNPIAVIVPCHRVIGANGTLTGYGGGLPRKAALLAFEAAVRRNGPVAFPPIAEPVPLGI